MYDEISRLLGGRGFLPSNIRPDTEPTQVLFLKQRGGGLTAVPLNVPMDCDGIPDSVLGDIMSKAGVPEPEYRHLLKANRTDQSGPPTA